MLTAQSTHSGFARRVAQIARGVETTRHADRHAPTSVAGRPGRARDRSLESVAQSNFLPTSRGGTMEVEIWSDVACPWCYVGKRRFETALAEVEHRDDVTITWRSFELDPEAPSEREGDRAEHLASKYGMSLEQAHQAEAQMPQTAAADGLDFRFDIARAGNTFDGHRLVHLARAHGLQDAMKERLLHAYFSEGELVSDHDALTRLAVEVGVPEDEVREMLASDRYAAGVR